MDIHFYHLMQTSLEQALPELLEKTLNKKWRAVVKTTSGARAEEVAALLWLHRRESFLPHGTTKDGFAPEQPIWITAESDFPNKPDVLFLIDGAESLETLPCESLNNHEESKDLAGFTRVCLLFDGQDSSSVDYARKWWKVYKDQGFALYYWQQTDRGWSLKNEEKGKEGTANEVKRIKTPP